MNVLAYRIEFISFMLLRIAAYCISYCMYFAFVSVHEQPNTATL